MSESLDSKIRRLFNSAKIAFMSGSQFGLERGEYVRQTVSSRLCRAYDCMIKCDKKKEREKARKIYFELAKSMPGSSSLFEKNNLEPSGYRFWKNIQLENQELSSID